jgi:hypothetical protein
MSGPIANPPRLSRLPDGESLHPAARLFRDARELPEEDLPKLMWRIRASQRRRALRPRLILRLVLVVGGVFCMGGFVGAYWERRQSAHVTPPAPTRPTVVPAATKTRPPVHLPEAPAALPEPTPASPPKPVESLQKEPKSHASTRARAHPRVAMVDPPTFVAEPPPPPPSPIAAEQALITRAMESLRDRHQAQAALALLGDHAQQFPNGSFRSEANLLRVEALLALGRKDEALSVLERAPITATPNRDEQLVLRGELRSSNERWVEAREDFDEALRRYGDTLAEPAKSRGLQERALWGRAAARSRLGHEADARADLALYLRLFPHGRFADSAAKLLKPAP